MVVQGVAFLILADLVGPEFNVGRWGSVVLATLVSVPEAAVYEYDGAVFRQDDIRSTGESLDIDTISKTGVEQRLAHFLLRPGIA